MSTASDLGARIGPGPAVIAVDVGGTDMKSALIDAEGRVLGLDRSPTRHSTGEPAEAVIAGVAAAAKRLRAAHADVDVVAVGVSVPGLVDEAAGVGIFSGNLGWRDAPLRDLAETAVGLPVAFGHDVRAAGLAEHRLGAARGLDDVLVVAIGTGIAGAIVADGRLYTGGGMGGEIGHALSDPRGERCPCGAIGCLETIASAASIARRYSARSGRPVPGSREVLDARNAGDSDAAAVWDDAVEALAQQLARVAAILAPQAVLIGGGLAHAGDDLFQPLGARLEALLSFHRRPRLLPAELGGDAGLIGTALAARDLARERSA